MTTIKNLIQSIDYKTKYKDLFNIPFQLPYQRTNVSKLKILLICVSCYGLGDIIFCLKIYNYLKSWYNIDCTILTTKPDMFKESGIKKIIKFTGKNEECTNLKNLKHPKLNIFDLIFITPWIGTEFDPAKSQSIIKHIIPYTNKFNTFLFSEYNSGDYHKYDFPTGLGPNLFGLLINKPPKKLKKELFLKNPYIMIYIADNESDTSFKCFSNFVKFMSKKYKNLNKLDIIIPKFIPESFLLKLGDYIIKHKYFNNVYINESKYIENNSVTFKSISGLPYKRFVNLFRYCLPDVLITGDQSLSDIISCCTNYNIYYQIMPWKKNLAKNLAKILHKPFLSKTSQSCGLEKMNSSQKMDIIKLVNNYNFEHLAKDKMDSIIFNTFKINYGSEKSQFKEIFNIILKSRKTHSVIKQLYKHEFI